VAKDNARRARALKSNFLLEMTRTVRNHSGFRYLVVGGSSFVLDFMILYVLHEIVEIRLWLATGLALLCSFAYNFTLQKVLTFSSTAQTPRSLVKYLILVAVNAIATIGIVAVLSTFIGWIGAKIVATILTTVWNYLAYRYIIFVDRPFAQLKRS
jgi:putative flippase GtrA